MKVRYCYFGLVSRQENETLVDKLRFIYEVVSKYNHKYNVSGVFYYANQSFFHCIEGNKNTVDKLVKYLATSDKITEINKIEEIEIQNHHYIDWTMKYVHKDSNIMSFFHELDYPLFLPLSLSDDQKFSLMTVILNELQDPLKVKHAKGYKNRGKNFY